jgi:hypothetical protein
VVVQPIIPAIGRLRQEDGEFEASLGPVSNLSSIKMKLKIK